MYRFRRIYTRDRRQEWCLWRTEPCLQGNLFPAATGRRPGPARAGEPVGWKRRRRDPLRENICARPRPVVREGAAPAPCRRRVPVRTRPRRLPSIHLQREVERWQGAAGRPTRTATGDEPRTPGEFLVVERRRALGGEGKAEVAAKPAVGAWPRARHHADRSPHRHVTGSVWRCPRRCRTRKRRCRSRARRTGAVSINSNGRARHAKAVGPGKRTDRLHAGRRCGKEQALNECTCEEEARRAGSDFSPQARPRKPAPAGTSVEAWSPCGAGGSR